MDERRVLWAVIALSTVLRLAISAGLGVGNDEAYHALLALHLDWSYFDHPPMLALVGRIGLILGGGALSPFSLRLGFIALSAGSTLLMARLAGRLYGPRAGMIAALILNFTAYYGVAAATFALPDGPLLFFWLLTLDRMVAAMSSPGKLWPWIAVGLAWGGAMLSKYHGIFLPVGLVLLLIVEPKTRRILREPGPYLACAIGLALFSPVIGWNAVHGWVSFTFQAGRAGGGLSFNGRTLMRAIVGQAAYLFPWTWLFLWGALIRSALRVLNNRDNDRRDERSSDRFLLCQAIPPLGLFLAVACRQNVFPHWSLVGMIPAFPLLGRDWAATWPAPSKRLRRRFVILGLAPVLGGLLLVVQAQTGFLQKGKGHVLGFVPMADDPTTDMVGWDTLAAELGRRGLLDRPGPFLFTSKWYHSGHLAFATGNRVPVHCYSPGGGHAFDSWTDPDAWVGRDGLLVVINESSIEPGVYKPWFERIEPAGEFEVTRTGVPVRRVRLYRCKRQTRPFPREWSRGPMASTRSPSPAIPSRIADEVQRAKSR